MISPEGVLFLILGFVIIASPLISLMIITKDLENNNKNEGE